MDVSQASLTLEREKKLKKAFSLEEVYQFIFISVRKYICVCVYYVSGNMIPCKEGNLHMRTITQKNLKY